MNLNLCQLFKRNNIALKVYAVLVRNYNFVLVTVLLGAPNRCAAHLKILALDQDQDSVGFDWIQVLGTELEFLNNQWG
jgi:hypothetical protein